MVIFIFFNMAATAILDFQNFIYSTVRTVKRIELHHYAKLCRKLEIASNVAEISRFVDISRWPPPPCLKKEILHFSWLKRSRSRSASISVPNFVEIT